MYRRPTRHCLNPNPTYVLATLEISFPATESPEARIGI
jgi:hypothetical protein